MSSGGRAALPRPCGLGLARRLERRQKGRPYRVSPSTCEWVYTEPIEVVLRGDPTLTACFNAWRRPTLPVLEH